MTCEYCSTVKETFSSVCQSALIVSPAKGTDEDAARKEFENFILNNRMDDPKQYGIRRDGVTQWYEDPRLNVGWACWQAK